MLPLFPILAILTAVVLDALLGKVKAPYGTILKRGLLTGLLAVTLAYQIIFFVQVRPVGVIVGMETKAEFLSRVGTNYASMRFIEEDLPDGSRAVLINDGRGYFCDERCVMNTDHTAWTRLTQSSDDLAELQQNLAQLGITHIVFSIPAVDFILQRDPGGEHQHAVEVFEDLRDKCLEEIYRDSEAVIYEIRCSGG